MSLSLCSIETLEDVVLVRLQHGKANAFDPPLVDELRRLARDLAGGAGAVVLTGHASFFSAGLDLKAVHAMGRDAFTAFMRDFVEMIASWYTLPRPVLCAVNGHAIAGGCILSQVGDLRLGARGRYRIGVNELDLGVPFPASLMRMFADRLGAPAAYRAIATSELFDPEGALAIGYLDGLADDVVAEALERGHVLARLPSWAFAANKAYARDPVVQAMADLDTRHLPGFVEAWFGPARPRIEALVKRLGG